jgi:hypothetical protein
MLSNKNYNLIEAISVISQFLSRYDTYMKDSGDCEACRGIWTEMKNHREEELGKLLKELKAQMDQGKV